MYAGWQCAGCEVARRGRAGSEERAERADQSHVAHAATSLLGPAKSLNRSSESRSPPCAAPLGLPRRAIAFARSERRRAESRPLLSPALALALALERSAEQLSLSASLLLCSPMCAQPPRSRCRRAASLSASPTDDGSAPLPSRPRALSCWSSYPVNLRARRPRHGAAHGTVPGARAASPLDYPSQALATQQLSN